MEPVTGVALALHHGSPPCGSVGNGVIYVWKQRCLSLGSQGVAGETLLKMPGEKTNAPSSSDAARRPPTPASNDGRHLIFQVMDQRGAAHDAIFFGAGERLDELRGAGRVDLATELRRDVWNGRVKLKLRVTDFRPAG